MIFILNMMEKYINSGGVAGGNYDKTLAEVGVIELAAYDESTKVGKYVQYDEKNWIVLYDDEMNGLQIISEKVLLDNGNESYLGSEDTSFTEDEVTEIDGVEGISELEKAMYSYNNAITTLNEKCAELVIDKSKVARDESGNYKIRSVGSDPINPNEDTINAFIASNETIPEYGTSTWFEDNLNLQKNIEERTYYTMKGTETEYIIKNTDSNYLKDFDRMVGLGIHQDMDDLGSTYLLASRTSDYTPYSSFSEGLLYFGVVQVAYSSLYFVPLWYNDFYGEAFGGSSPIYVRPVVTLKEGALDNVTGEGTPTSPYVLD